MFGYDILKTIMSKTKKKMTTKKSSITKNTKKAAKGKFASVKKTVAENLGAQPLNKKLQGWNQKLFRLAIVIAAVAGLAYLVKNVFLVALVNKKPISRYAVIKQLEKTQGKAIMEQLVNEALIEQATKKSGIVIEQTVVDEAIKEIEDNISAQGQSLETLLSAQGMTKKDLIEQITLQKKIEAILQDKVQITDEEVAEYLESNAKFLPEDKTEEELNNLAREQLAQQKMSQEFQTWMETVKNEANIKYLREY